MTQSAAIRSEDQGSVPAVFGDHYSSSYDLVYREKDYDGECALLERIFNDYGGGRIRSILDLGCGTGNHSVRLASRGYDMAGVDMSPHMLRCAERKAVDAGVPLSLHRADVRDVSLDRKFDAVLLMFAVLGYQLENDDVMRVLGNARSHLGEGGLLIFDVWYGPAVLAQKPQDRVRVLQDNGRRFLRSSTGTLDPFRHRCCVDIRLRDLAGDGSETAEQHFMRYFFPQELALFLTYSGFKLRRLGVFPDIEKDPTEETWNIVTIAEAV